MEAFFDAHPDEACLWQFVFSHDVAAVRKILRQAPGIDLNLRHPLAGTTVILAAAEEYHHEATGTDEFVGAPRRHGGATYQILELLLRRGADVNTGFRNPASGNTLFPMSIICGQGITEGVKLFIDAAAGLDVMAPGAIARAGRGRAVLWPLTQAIVRGHDDVARLLICHRSFDAGRDSLVLAATAEADNSRILRELLSLPGSLRVIDLPHPNPSVATGTPLTAACWSGHSCVEMLLAAGADPLIDRSGKRPVTSGDSVETDCPAMNMTPMACALSSGAEPHVIELLVGAGARRPVIEKRGDGSHVLVGRDGRDRPILDMRTFSGAGMKVSMGSPGSLRPSASTGLVDDRFDKFACSACGKLPEFGAALLRCGRCKRASYCNSACQKAHWREHKAVCTKE